MKQPLLTHRPCIALDMDGTLCNPIEGIVNGINLTLRSMGLPIRPSEELHKYIGPPIGWIFRDLLGTDDPAVIKRGRRIFSDYYRDKGYRESHLYPGIRQMLETLRQQGHLLLLVTAKSTSGAHAVVHHHQIHHLMDGIYGREGDREKTETLMLALGEEGVRGGTMVGDRKYDMEAASHCGCVGVGVTWGFGTRAELLQAGADHLVASPTELLELLSKKC